MLRGPPFSSSLVSSILSSGICFRQITSTPTPESLRQQYQEKKDILYSQYKDQTVNKRGVFTNAELSLKHISVYGFDYDFTLIQYTNEVMDLLYDTAKNIMSDEMAYPHSIKSLKFNPDSVIRGLHLDIRNGLLMKMDAYHHVQLGSVHKGHELLDQSDVIELYGGTHVPLYILDDEVHRTNIITGSHIQFLDTFSLPEIALFSDVSQYLVNDNIDFDPEYLYLDIKDAIARVHTSGILHDTIMKDPDRFIKNLPYIPQLLSRLKNAGKKLFLLTNNRFNFVDKGMRHVTKSSDWRDLFDVIVCAARKPKFYSEVNRPFRLLDPSTYVPTWHRVTKLEAGNKCIYHQGNINELIKLTGWKGGQVLYLGDHVLSDLIDPSLNLGWKTGAIIPELETEINKLNSNEYKDNLSALIALEVLLKEHQGYSDPRLIEIVNQWRDERATRRQFLKRVFNPHFGSVFRTEKGPTYFSRRLMRFANLYMSSLDNLMDYSLDHTFYSRRASLPHEPDANFDV